MFKPLSLLLWVSVSSLTLSPTSCSNYSRAQTSLLPEQYRYNNANVSPASHRMDNSLPIRTFTELFDFIGDQTENLAPGTFADLSSGSAHEPPPQNYTDILAKYLIPQNSDWFGYKNGVKTSKQYIANELNSRMKSATFNATGITLTNGALGALSTIIAATCSVGDEVIALTPTYFHYDPLITNNGCKIVKVPTDPDTWLPNVNNIRQAITSRTAGILINTPCNPSGIIYSPQILTQIGRMLDAVNANRQKPVVVFADEAYRRIIYENHTFYSPCDYIKLCVISYTWGKQLLAPGQRVGYLAIPNSFNEPMFQNYTKTIMANQMVPWHFPNVILQYAIPEIDQLIIDMSAIQRRRDRLYSILSGLKLQVTKPAGTFYLVMKIPQGWGQRYNVSTLPCGTEDDYGFMLKLAEQKLYVLPGHVHDMPGWIRFSVTGTDTMISYAEPILKHYLSGFSSNQGKGKQAKGKQGKKRRL